MSRILIVGYGNPIRGDDALGWRATERLRELVTDPGVEILTLHQLAPELMEPLSQVDLAIFIDAAEGPEPGVMLERRIEPRASGSASFTHRATPEALLWAARALYGRAAEGRMITVTGADFSYSMDLSPTVAARLEDVVAAALGLIGEPFAGPCS
ncbi:MAG: hydrogenase maturation protease [Bryobacteraceae bacterium]|jgi:hydrogenase maturation protease